jgi:hypothetical protein
MSTQTSLEIMVRSAGSLLQFIEAKGERIEADDILRQAERALERAFRESDEGPRRIRALLSDERTRELAYLYGCRADKETIRSLAEAIASGGSALATTSKSD